MLAVGFCVEDQVGDGGWYLCACHFVQVGSGTQLGQAPVSVSHNPTEVLP